MIYTLAPGATSKFKDIKICSQRCIGGEELKFVLSAAKKLLLAKTFIITMSVMIGSIYI